MKTNEITEMHNEHAKQTRKHAENDEGKRERESKEQGREREKRTQPNTDPVSKDIMNLF